LNCIAIRFHRRVCRLAALDQHGVRGTRLVTLIEFVSEETSILALPRSDDTAAALGVWALTWGGVAERIDLLATAGATALPGHGEEVRAERLSTR
jgi:uncharacterized membrane protein